MAPFDTLKLAQRLRDDAGLSQLHAEGAAQAIAESMGTADLATKADVAALNTELQAVRTELKAELRELEQRMTIKLGGMLVVGFGLVLAAPRFVHPGPSFLHSDLSPP